jgi:hypothetical protein
MSYLDQIRMKNLAASNMNKMNPAPRPGAESIVAVVMHAGEITGYKLSGGQIVSKQEGVQLARSGHIRGVGIAENKGSEYLRSLPDGEEDNNLGRLPVIDDSNPTFY